MVYTAAFPQSGSSSAGIRVISASDIGQATSTGEIPLLFSRSAVGSLKSPVLGQQRLRDQVNGLTSPPKDRVAQIGHERPFSLYTSQGSDPQPGIEPRPHWRETDMLPIGHLSTQYLHINEIESPTHQNNNVV